MPLTTIKFNEIKAIIQNVIENKDESAITKFQNELNAGLDIQSHEVDGQSIAEYIIEIYTNGLDVHTRNRFRAGILEPVLKKLGDAINAPNPKSKQPMLHQILNSPPATREQLNSAHELLEIFYQHNADFNALDASKGTVAHRVASNWVSAHGKDFAPDVLKDLYRYGCGFNRLNNAGETVADLVKDDNEGVKNTVHHFGGRKQAEISPERQLLIEKLNKDKYMDRSRSLLHIEYKVLVEKELGELYAATAAELVQKARDAKAQAPQTADAAEAIDAKAQAAQQEATKKDIQHRLALYKNTIEMFKREKLIDSYAHINEFRDGKTAAHKWLLFLRPEELKGALRGKQLTLEEQLQHKIRMLDDYSKEEYAEFCAHGLRLDLCTQDGRNLSGLDLINIRGVTEEFMNEPRIRTAIQSQFDHKTIRSLLNTYPDIKTKQAVVIPAAQPKVESIKAKPTVAYRAGTDKEVLFRSDAELKANPGDASFASTAIKSVFTGCTMGVQSMFKKNAAHLTADMWRQVAQNMQEAQPTQKKKGPGNLNAYIKDYYNELASLDKDIQAEFKARLPQALKLVLEKTIAASFATDPRTLHGASAAKTTTPKDTKSAEQSAANTNDGAKPAAASYKP